ncbi:MAG: PGN_0703 family putative restriction endonuclease [Terriglobales bacterium]
MSSTTTAAVARYSAALRYELSLRNHAYAEKHNFKHCASYGSQPVICYEPDGATHGNFLPPTYRAIVANPQWSRRLHKAHTSARTALPRNDRGFWSELDSSNSSDALLMNLFCFPGVFRDGRVRSLLGLDEDAVPEFGFKARVPLANGKFDRTEVDMRLGNLLVEAKLTESDFQSREKGIVGSYRDFEDVFDRKGLPVCHGSLARAPEEWPTLAGAASVGKKPTHYASYQLIRNVLAAHASGCSFCVLYDERRPDLREAWYAIMSCVRSVDLRLRCKALTWQELAAVTPKRLAAFLEEKYGIVPDL